MADLEELVSFLSLSSGRLDLKSVALDYVLGLTGSKDGQELVGANQSVLKCLLDLTKDAQPLVSRDAYLALINLSTSEGAVDALLCLNVIPGLLKRLVDPNNIHADKICMILSNLTHSERGALEFVKAIAAAESGPADDCPLLHQLVDIFDRPGYNKDANFHYMATVFSNITHVPAARLMIMDRAKCIVQRCLPYTQYRGSLVRRGGVVGMLRNLCFEVGSHQWLLSDEVDILPCLLLPLAGPEQFEGEEDKMEQLPDDLQYLPDDKQRESDPDIRKMLLESIVKLCATQYGRQYLRAKQVYLILRELDKWEQDQDVSTSCKSVISILIADEPEQGMENLDEVVLPPGFAGSN